MLSPVLQYVLPVLLLAFGLMIWFLIQVASGRAPNDHGEGVEHGCSACSQTGTCSTAYAPEPQRVCSSDATAHAADAAFGSFGGDGVLDLSRAPSEHGDG